VAAQEAGCASEIKHSMRLARLALALVVFANATAALAAPRVVVHGCASAQAVIEATRPGRLQVRVQRLPRVPRREPFEAGPSTAAADADE
jgi:hypothetical protein